MRGSKVTSDQNTANISGKDDKGQSYNGNDANKKAVLRDTEGILRRGREKGLLQVTYLQTRPHEFLKEKSRVLGLISYYKIKFKLPDLKL